MSTRHILINGDSRHMSMIADSSVQLIVTSPPYWQLKDYGTANQIGFNDTYEQYINYLNIVWLECFRILQNGCRLCINIGDQFARSAYYGRYKVIPIHSEIIRFCETIGFDFMGSIIWQKPTSMHTTGGAMVMGSYLYPRGGIIKIDFEHILLFRKQGNAPSVSYENRNASKLSEEEWNTYFSSHWQINGEHQNRHIAVFPKELPMRLIKMFSFVGDTICDPFMGSGTTALAARETERNSIGYEINPDFRLFYQEKVIASNPSPNNAFEFINDHSVFDYSDLLEKLPYQFVDVHKLNKQVDVKGNPYGSKFAVDDVTQNELLQSNIPDTFSFKKEADGTLTVLVNHVAKDIMDLSIHEGITYVRAGESKGSLLVQEGFTRLSFVCLHTGGENAKLFKLKKKGCFQIWTKETLEAHGFHPTHAPYYIVLPFDNKKEVEFKKLPQLRQRINTYRAKIRPLSDFIGIE